MARGIVTYHYNNTTIGEKIAKKALEMGLCKIIHEWNAFIDPLTGERCWYQTGIEGNWLIVKLLERVTSPRLTRKDYKFLEEFMKKTEGS